MNRQSRRALAKVEKKFYNEAAKGIAKNCLADKWTEWIEATPEELAQTPLDLWSAYKNNRYVVQVCNAKYIPEIGMCQRIMIRDNLARPIHNWSDFQRIKNELFGEDREAIEVYPPQSDLVDEANIYHLWILPQGYKSPFNFNQ